MDTYIYLIDNGYTQDKRGVWRKNPTPRGVFVQMKSVTRTEFFDGGRNGLNPAYQFTIFNADYNGEKVIEYNGEQYGVYRTYVANTDYIELYVERKGGLNVETKNDT